MAEQLADKKLSSLLNENSNFKALIEEYNIKLNTASQFILKDKFIIEEINRIKTKFIRKKIEIKAISGTIISSFSYSAYIEYAYDWLMSGRDLSLNEIIKSARSQYLEQFGQILDEKEFRQAVLDNLCEGVAYVKYESFLNEQLVQIKNEINVPPLTHKQSLIMKLLSNPWIVTVIGGLLIAFLAKSFGWV